jgi:flagellar hook-associated protein 3 FlgL
MPSSIRFYTQTINDFRRLQNELYDKQSLVGADTKANTYKQLGNDISTVANLTFAADKTARYVTAGNEASRRIDSIFNAMGDILKIAENFKTVLMLENSSSANVNDLKSAASSALDSLQSALNSRDGSMYLFGGSRTDVEPVSQMNVTNSLVNGQPTANYYNGDSYKFSVSVNSTLTIDYGVTAADEPFAKFAAALNIAKNIEANGGSMEEAGNLLNEAIDGIIAMRATIGYQQNTIKQTVAMQESANVALKQNLAEINSPDTVSLTIEIASLSAALQATFQNFTAISRLRLTDYI